MTHAPIDLTGDLDGYALRFKGAVIDRFPSLEGARAGYRAAKAALTMLDAVLAPQVDGAA